MTPTEKMKPTNADFLCFGIPQVLILICLTVINTDAMEVEQYPDANEQFHPLAEAMVDSITKRNSHDAHQKFNAQDEIKEILSPIHSEFDRVPEYDISFKEFCDLIYHMMVEKQQQELKSGNEEYALYFEQFAAEPFQLNIEIFQMMFEMFRTVQRKKCIAERNQNIVDKIAGYGSFGQLRDQFKHTLKSGGLQQIFLKSMNTTVRNADGNHDAHVLKNSLLLEYIRLKAIILFDTFCNSIQEILDHISPAQVQELVTSNSYQTEITIDSLIFSAFDKFIVKQKASEMNALKSIDVNDPAYRGHWKDYLTLYLFELYGITDGNRVSVNVVVKLFDANYNLDNDSEQMEKMKNLCLYDDTDRFKIIFMDIVEPFVESTPTLSGNGEADQARFNAIYLLFARFVQNYCKVYGLADDAISAVFEVFEAPKLEKFFAEGSKSSLGKEICRKFNPNFGQSQETLF